MCGSRSILFLAYSFLLWCWQLLPLSWKLSPYIKDSFFSSLFAIRIFSFISTILCDLRDIFSFLCRQKTHISDILLKETIIYEIILCLSYTQFLPWAEHDKKAVLNVTRNISNYAPAFQLKDIPSDHLWISKGKMMKLFYECEHFLCFVGKKHQFDNNEVVFGGFLGKALNVMAKNS